MLHRRNIQKAIFICGVRKLPHVFLIIIIGGNRLNLGRNEATYLFALYGPISVHDGGCKIWDWLVVHRLFFYVDSQVIQVLNFTNLPYLLRLVCQLVSIWKVHHFIHHVTLILRLQIVFKNIRLGLGCIPLGFSLSIQILKIQSWYNWLLSWSTILVFRDIIVHFYNLILELRF